MPDYKINKKRLVPLAILCFFKIHNDIYSYTITVERYPVKPFIRPQNVLLTTALSDAVVVVRVVVVVVGNAP